MRGSQLLDGSRRTARLVQAAALASLVSVGACGPEYTPHVVTYEADIRPLVLSRCVRCHGAGGRLNMDPAAPKDFNTPINGYFDQFADPPCPDGGTGGCKHGMGFYTTDPGKTQLTNYLHPKPGAFRMPPPPSPALTSIQLRIFDDWLAETPPREK